MQITHVSIIPYNKLKQALLHVRDNKPGINHPNKISLFGGAVEDSESLEEAVTREAAEELNNYTLEDFKYLGQYDAGYELHVFVKYEPDKKLSDYVVTEGQGAIFADKEDLEFLDIPDVVRPILNDFFNYVDKNY
jgi:8-oxo-dGTP pyrophosphatase MutT (NUDIX family)